MYKYILQSAGDINWMAIFALLTFVFMFLISAFVIFARGKDYINHMSNLPLDEDSNLVEPEIQIIMKNQWYKSGLILTFLVLVTTGLWAQDAEAVVATSSGSFNDFLMQNIVLIIGGVIALAAFFAIIYVNNQLMQLQKIRLLQEHGIKVMEEVKLISKEPLWKQWYKSMTKAVPIEKEEDILMNHNYDGIQELDNSLPPWWVAMFYITIAFGVVYFAYYHLTDYGQSSQEWYESEVAQAEEAVKAYLASQSDLVDETNVEMLQDESAIALGESIFQANCVACHGQFGEGGVGPNLTDKYWIHGGNIKDVFRTIKYGVPEKGMISWKAQLRSGDMHKVASYIMTLVGTNPPNGKAPEGDPYEDNGENVEVQDSTAGQQIGQLLNN